MFFFSSSFPLPAPFFSSLTALLISFRGNESKRDQRSAQQRWLSWWRPLWTICLRGCLSLSASMRLEVLAPSCYLAKPCACWWWGGKGRRKGRKNLSLHSAVGCHDPCILVTSPGAGTRPHLGIFFVPSASYSSTFLASLRGKGGDCIAFSPLHEAHASVWNSSRTSLTTVCVVNVNTVVLQCRRNWLALSFEAARPRFFLVN